jgi:hypothetical protein
MNEILTQTYVILGESAPYLLLGFLLAGVLHVALSRFPQITALFTAPGQRSVYTAALLGLPLPLCSCSVLPAAMTLRRKGASKGAMASFLISVPETDVVSILLTFALLGGVMAVYRPAAALATAVAAGLLVNIVDRRIRARHMAEHHGADATRCDCRHDEHDDRIIAPTAGPWWKQVLRHGFVEVFDDIVAQLFVGIVVAGVLMAWLPDVGVARSLGASAWSYALMLVIGVPAYVCAVASTPVAAGLIAGGLSPGAAMVFLLAGPATNIASLFVLKGEFGKRVFAVYLAVIAGGSVLFGALFDALPLAAVPAREVAADPARHSTSAVETALTAVFLILLVASFRRTRILSRARAGVLRLVPRGTQR